MTIKILHTEVKSSVIECGASDISGHCNKINELKVCAQYAYGGKGHLCHLLGQNMTATIMAKTCPETKCCEVHCDSKGFQCSHRSYSFSKDLFNFPFSAVAFGDSTSQNMMLLLFHDSSRPLMPPHLLWSKWPREAVVMHVVHGVLKGTFPSP